MGVFNFQVRVNHNGEPYTLNLYDTAGQVNKPIKFKIKSCFYYLFANLRVIKLIFKVIKRFSTKP